MSELFSNELKINLSGLKIKAFIFRLLNILSNSLYLFTLTCLISVQFNSCFESKINSLSNCSSKF